ncbi:MAG: hypothetical protein K8L99_33285 [Anaerolineae bacterium]|nr:hypothetical protein [Anaerolineae bacterium]
MNDLLDTFAMLATAMLDDPLLTLANAVCWLDPLWETSEDDVYEEGDGVGLALCITRSAFPDIYAGAVERIRSGAAEKELDSFICGAISQRGIPLDNLEFLGYGIPLTACGIELSDPDLYAARADLLPLVELFGIRPEPGHYNVEVPDCAYTAGRIIADSLVQQDDAGLKQVGWALAWLFSCSGNTLIDYDDEALAEIPPLTWDQDDLAFAIELIEETGCMLRYVNAGLKLLEANPSLFAALETNIQRTYKTIAKMKGKNDEPRIRLEWPPLITGGDGAAVPDPEFLQLRGDAA